MKRVISVLVTFAITLGCFCFSPFSTVASANCSANDLVSVAKGEIGNWNAKGTRNKYTLWNGRIGGDYANKDNGYGYPWCATFVSWCANQAGCLDVISKTASCNSQWADTIGEKYFPSSGRTPKAGDLIFFDYGTSNSAQSLDHVGIVEWYDSSSKIVHTIEGNCSNSVKRVNRSYTSNDIFGFIAPRYNGSGSQSNTCSCSTNYAGEYIVTTQSSPLTMRSGHGTGYSQITTIPKGAHVTISKANGSWAHVSYNGYNGYCSMGYLTKVNKPHGSPMSKGAGKTVADGEYHIVSYKDSEYGVTVRGVVPNDGANIDLWNDMHTDSNAFVFTYLNNGFYKIINKTTGKALDVENADTDRGTNVIQWTYNGGNNQQWSIESAGDGVYFIRSKCSGYYLDLYEATIAQGNNIQLWEKTNLDSQGWRLISWGEKPTATLNLSSKVVWHDICKDSPATTITATVTLNTASTMLFDVDPEYFLWEFGELKEKDGVYTVPIKLKSTKKIGNCTAKAKIVTQDSNAELLAQETIDLRVYCSHDYDDWKINTAPTCTRDGSKSTTCRYCGKTETKTVPARGNHRFGDWIISKFATEDTAGEEVRCCKVCNKKEIRSTPKLEPAPSDITNFRVTSVTSNSVTLSWNKSKGATRYELHSEETFNKYYIDNGETTTYTVSGLEPNKHYTFSIRAYNLQGFSEEVSTAATTRCLAIDSLKVVSTKTDSADITWENDRAVNYYHIMLFDNGKWTTECEYLGDGQLFDYRIKDLKPATDFKIRIDAYNANNRLLGSSKTVVFTTEIAAIDGFKAVPSKKTMKLTWGKTNSAEYYKVFVWKNNKWTQLTQMKNNATTYTASKLSANTSYKFRVKAYNNANKVIAFSDISTKTLANISNLKATPSKNTAKLTWSKNNSAKYYKVFIWKNNKWTQLTQMKNNATTYTASKLSANTSYKFRVKAYNNANKVIAFSDISTKTLANISNLKATPSKNAVKFTWGKLCSAKNYGVSVLKKGKWVKMAQTKSNKTLSYTIARLKSNTNYKFRLEALNGKGKVIGVSEVSVRTKK